MERSTKERCSEEPLFFYIMEAAEPEQGGMITDPQAYRARSLHSELWRRKRIPPRECIDLGLHLTAALDYLHRQRLVHRDIKPANIIYVDGQPKFADIGLMTDVSSTITDNSFVGTQGYIPPEGPGRPEADVFALGMVLFESVAGQSRKEFPTVPDELARIAGLTDFMRIVNRACGYDVLARYQTAAEVHRDLLALKGKLHVPAAV